MVSLTLCHLFDTLIKYRINSEGGKHEIVLQSQATLKVHL